MKAKKTLAALLTLSMLTSTIPFPAYAAEGKTFKDGTYTGTATVTPDEYLDFDAYSISVDVTVSDGAISGVAFAEGNTFGDDETNETYANRAMNGRGSQKGLAEQIVANNGTQGVDAVSTATCTSNAIVEAVDAALENAEDTSGDNDNDPVAKSGYILMNIPYADFYAAELENDVAVDAVSSATLNKTRTGSLVGGSYHVNADGSSIDGITFPVKVDDLSVLEGYKQVTDTDSVTITVTNRGQTSETTYTGKDALFENADYAYYVLSEEPAYYKELTVNEDGSLSFGKVVGEATAIDATAELTTETGYGDYQVSVDGLSEEISTVYAVVLDTEEGDSYGLRHLENVWRTSELAWSTGFVTETHGCQLSYEHYVSLMGQTITGITYYTDAGIYAMSAALYVPVKFETELTVTAEADAETADVTIGELPEGFESVYAVDGAEVTISEGKLSLEGLSVGSHTLTVSDKSGKYVALSADFVVSTSAVVAVYNGDNTAPALVAEEGADEEDLSAYLANISSVSVNGTSYAASGRGAVTIINKENGAIDLEAKSGEIAIFGEAAAYQVTVSSAGYPDLTFTLDLTKTEEPFRYLDLPEKTTDNAWYFEAVYAVRERGLMVGYPNNTFLPQNNMIRAEAVSVIVALAGIDVAEYQDVPCAFPDVAEDYWAITAITAAYENGLIAGYPNGTFVPEGKITREEFATMLVAALGIDVEQYQDKACVFPDVTGWSVNYVTAAYENGLVNGYPDGTFGPHNNIKRCEVAVMLNNSFSNE